MKFFKDIETLEDLRNQYKTLVYIHHPDKGGNVEDMQALNNEYEKLREIYKNKHRTKEGKVYTKQSTAEDVPDKFVEIINDIIKFNVRIEIIGEWIWVFNAYQCKDILKQKGFFYCSNKKAWAWAENPKTNKFKLTLKQIRNIYDSQVIKDIEQQQKITVGA